MDFQVHSSNLLNAIIPMAKMNISIMLDAADSHNV